MPIIIPSLTKCVFNRITLQVDPESGRRDQSSSCSSTQQSFQLTFKTDGYGYETSYKVEKRNSNGSWSRIAYGPNDGKKYQGRTEYPQAPICLDGGDTYRLTMIDSGKDGLCCSYGKGMYQYSLDGDVKFSTNYQQAKFQKVSKTFVVPLVSLACKHCAVYHVVDHILTLAAAAFQ